MEIIQTDKNSQPDLSSTTPTRGNPGGGKRDGGSGGGDRLNTGIGNQRYSAGGGEQLRDRLSPNP